MASTMPKEIRGSFPLTKEPDHATHPGVLLGDELEEREMTQRELAELMGRPAQLVSDLVRGKRSVTPDTALQLERALNISARFWLNLQTQYDLVLARRRQSA